MSNQSSERGFFRNAFEALIEGRERQARQHVARMGRLYGEDFFPTNNKH